MSTTGDRSRARWLLAAGVADSFGLSLGWTMLTLLAVQRGGLPEAGLYNAAMFVGIVISAPAAAWLSARATARTLLAATGAVELVLRVGVVAALVAGCAPGLVAAAIVVMNVMAFVAYAGMRAEVAAVEPGAQSLTRYATAIAAIEALGAAAAALLPLGTPAHLNIAVVGTVTAAYGASLVPQFACARGARASGVSHRPRHGGTAGRRASAKLDARDRRMPRHRDPQFARAHTLPALIGGCALMLIASGPATLGVALSAELDGQTAVLPAAIAFTAGCLLAPALMRQLSRWALCPKTMWPLLSVGMVVGWLVAPWQLSGLLLAQLCSGLGLTAFQGDMDARIADQVRPERVTSALASAAAVRAIGTAVAVRYLPTFVVPSHVNVFAAVAVAVIVAGALVVRTSDAARDPLAWVRSVVRVAAADERRLTGITAEPAVNEI